MSLVSAVPGKPISTTLYLAQAAQKPVSWSIRDNSGNIVLKGVVAPAGNTVVISGVLPSSVQIPLDGSKYSITATDGFTSAVEYFSVIAPQDLNTEHGVEIAYMCGRPFTDSLILPQPADCISIAILREDGTYIIPQPGIPVDCSPTRMGTNYVYTFNFAKTTLGASVTPKGSIDPKPMTSFATGTVIWSYTLEGHYEEQQEMHPFYTITGHSMGFLNAIRKQVDKARIGDVNNYLAYTTTDLCHSFIRGCDYVMQSPPVAGGWPIDQTPIALRDYIIKASALDILRAQYEAEGMSQFDLQGMRTTLQVDRTQYLATMIDQMTNDLQGLVQAKNEWGAQGYPMGNQIAAGVRPIAVLGLSRGTYSTWPMIPQRIVVGGYSWINGGMGYGPQF